MATKRQNVLILALVPALLLLPTGCYMSVAKDTSTPSVGSSTGGTTGVVSPGTEQELQTKVGTAIVRGMIGLMALELYAYLILFGCDEGSAAVVALAFFDALAFPLDQTTVDPDKPLEFAPFVAEQAVAALARVDFKLPAGKTKDEAVAAIVTGLMTGVAKNSGYGLSAADEATLLAQFAGSTVKGLDAAGVADSAAAVGAVAQALVAGLDDAGIAQAEAAVMTTGMMTALVGSLDEGGVTGATAVGAAVQSATHAAVAAMASGGITDTVVADAVLLAVSKGATAGLKDTGLTADEQSQVASKIAEGISLGMADAGYDSARIDAEKASISTQITDGLTANGATPEQVDTVNKLIHGLGH